MRGNGRRGAVLLAAAVLLLGAAALAGPLWASQAEAGGRIVAVGDVHGDLDGLQSILAQAALVDAGGHWIGGAATFVQTGDLVDRGTRVRGVLDRMRALQREAAAAGGRVVALLGNHELNNLVGYLDYQSTPLPVYTEIVSAFADGGSEKTRKRAYKDWARWGKDYPVCAQWTKEQWMAIHPPGSIEYLTAMGPEGEYGRWLRVLPVVARIGDTVFLHGGLSPKLGELGIGSLEEITPAIHAEVAAFDALKRELVEEGLALPFSTLPELYCAIDASLMALAPAPAEADTEPRPAEAPPDPKVAAERQRLEALRDRLPGPEHSLLFHEDGPVWFRGFAKWSDEEGPGLIDRVAATYGFTRAVVGHTPHPGRITMRFGGKVFLIDTAMAYGAEAGGKAAALEIDAGRFTAIYPDRRVVLLDGADAAAAEAPGAAAPLENGEQPPPVREPPVEAERPGPPPLWPHGPAQTRAPEDHPAADDEAAGPQEPQEPALTAGTSPKDASEPGDEGAPPAEPAHRWLGPDGAPLPFASDDEVLEFLGSAKVLDRDTIPVGVTQPWKLVLEKDGVRAHAVFRHLHAEDRGKRLADGRKVMFFRDSYENEVAAYALSRLLGMRNVPPATARRVARTKGSIQLWIENAMVEKERVEQKISPPDPLKWRQQWDDMFVFDNLINNIDRNQGNILIDEDWKMWLIDHTRAFGREQELPNPDRLLRCSRDLWRHLTTVDDETLTEGLRPSIGIYEIRSLLERRRKLVDHLRQKIEEEGENRVLFTLGEPSIEITYSDSEPTAPPPPP